MTDANKKSMKWKMVKLGNLAKIGAGQSAPKDLYFSTNEGTPFIRAGHLERLISGTDIETLPKIEKNVAEKHRLKLLQKGSILFAKSGMSAMMNRVFLIEKDTYYVSHLASVTPQKDKLDSKYCYFFLQHFKTSKLIKDSAYPSIGLPEIEKIEIPLPPLPIQKRIAEILDKADALRRKDQELLKKYDELAQAIFIDMFGDPVRNEKGWKVMKLGDLFSKSTKCGPFGSALKRSEYKKVGIPVWVMDNIQDYHFNKKGCLFIDENKYEEMKSYSVYNGDIIVSRAGTVGKMCVVESEVSKSIISTNLILLSLDEEKINPHFFVNLIKYFGRKIGRLKVGSDGSFTHMNTAVLSGLEFPLPPLNYQVRYVNVVSVINNQVNCLNRLPETLFQSLLQQAFQGELN